MSYKHDKPLLKHRGRHRKRRPKTFSSEDAANTWAAGKKIKEFDLVNLRVNDIHKKLRVVRK